MGKQNYKNIFFFCVCALWLNVSAAPIEAFVSPAGSGYDCTQASPCQLSIAIVDGYDSIYLAEGTYTGTGTDTEVLKINDSMSIYGAWDGTTTTPIVRDASLHVSIIDGENTRRGIDIGDDYEVEIDDITIANCDAEQPGAGLVVNSSIELRLKNVSFRDNYAHTDVEDYMYGGALYVRGGILRVENSTFINNSTRAKKFPIGGALAVIEANTTITGSNFNLNKSWIDSVLFFHGLSDASKSTLLFENNQLDSNGLQLSAYGIVTLEYADTEIRNNSFTNNLSKQGSLIKIDRSNLTLNNNIVTNNTTGWEAFLYLLESEFLIYNNIIAENNTTSDDYSVIHTISSSGKFIYNTIANNNADFVMSIGSLTSSISSDINLTNNIIIGNNVGLHVGQGAVVGLYSTLWGATSPQTQEDGTINEHGSDYSGDPEFTNDYHIGANSAARGRGEPSLGVADIDGDERPPMAMTDIGADQFTRSTSPALIMYLLN